MSESRAQDEGPPIVQTPYEPPMIVVLGSVRQLTEGPLSPLRSGVFS
jgi:hypothetical protein